MWIASQLGFFSIVQKEGAFHVRARVEGDLKSLVKASGVKAKIEEWPNADYRWRIRLKSQSSLGLVFLALQASVDYPNFKNRVAELPEQRNKLRAYSNLWHDLLAVQREAEPTEARGLTLADLKGGIRVVK